jgi:hypothetical protein
LNDEQEFQHALDLIKEILKTSKIPATDPSHPVLQKFLNEVREMLSSLDAHISETVFTLSFSEQTDLLSQWRGYCSSNNGYCIVFDAPKLYDHIKATFDDCHFDKCVYEESTKATKLRKALNESWHKYRQLTESKEQRGVIAAFGREVVIFAAYFKHLSFMEEQEHRMVVLGEYGDWSEKLSFRAGNSSLIPYVELPAPRRLIKEICIGPNSNKALAKRALEAFLEKSFKVPAFLNDVAVTLSSTPYRQW